MAKGSKTGNGLKLVDPDTCLTVSLDVGIGYTGVAMWLPGASLFRLFLITSQVLPEARKSHHMAEAILSAVYGAHSRYSLNPAQRVLLVVEGYGYGGGFFNVQQAEMIGMIKKAVIEFTHIFKGLVFLAPNTVKLRVAGAGKATKSMVKKAVSSVVALPKGATSHEADAVAVYLAYNKMWKNVTDETYKVSILHE